MARENKLTPKQERFVQEYLIDLNATQAAIRCGYSDKTAGQMGHELLKKPEISEAIEAAMEQRARSVGIDAEWVLQQAVTLHRRCMQEIYPVFDRMGNQIRDDEGNPLFAFDAKGAASALSMIGKHVRVKAFDDTLKGKIEGSLTVTVNTGVPRAPDE